MARIVSLYNVARHTRVMLAGWVVHSALALLLGLASWSSHAASYQAEAYGGFVDLTADSAKFGHDDLTIARQPWLVIDDADDGRTLEQTADGFYGTLLDVLTVASGALSVVVDPGAGDTRAAAQSIGLNVKLNEKQTLTLNVDRVESWAYTGNRCGGLQPRVATYLEGAVLSINGKRIALPSYPSANQVIDGADYGLDGITVTLNERVLTQRMRASATAAGVVGIHIRIDHESYGLSMAGDIMFAAGISMMECGRSDLSLSGTSKPSPAVVDQEMTYHFNINNPGPDVMHDVVLSDVVPASMDMNAVAATHGGSCSFVANDVSCTWPELAAGTTAQVQVRTTPRFAGTFDNTASLSSTDSDDNPVNNTIVVTSDVDDVTAEEADLSLALSMPATVMVDQAVTINGTITNHGPLSVGLMRAFIELPVNVQQLQASDGGVCAYQGNDLHLCDWSALAVNASVTFSADVIFTATGSTTVNAQVGALEPDPDFSNNQASQLVTVEEDDTVPELVVTMQATPTVVMPGDPVLIEVFIDNIGGGAASNVVLYDELSEDMTLNSVTPSTGGICAVTYPSVRCEWSTVAADGAASVELDTTVNVDAQDSNIANDAWVHADEICPETGAPCDITYTTVVLSF